MDNGGGHLFPRVLFFGRKFVGSERFFLGTPTRENGKFKLTSLPYRRKDTWGTVREVSETKTYPVRARARGGIRNAEKWATLKFEIRLPKAGDSQI